MTNTVRASNRAAILEVGEELRQLLHAEDPPMIRDRRYHLKVYEKCLMGHEMVDWLIKKGEVDSRTEAVAMMQKLTEHNVIHHGERQCVQHYCACNDVCVSVIWALCHPQGALEASEGQQQTIILFCV